MQYQKLNETDEYQLQHLGDFERLYPPMKLYEKTVVPEKVSDEPRPTDPMELKLWLHDQKMKKKRLEEERIRKEKERIRRQKEEEIERQRLHE